MDAIADDDAAGAAFWRRPLETLTQTLAAQPGGLDTAEAMARRQRFGANTLDAKRRFSFLRKLLSRFRNPLVLILLAAATISALTGDVASLAIIAAMVAFSVLLDSVQEYRAEQAADLLKALVTLRERVLRDGAEVVLPADQLVPGDIVLLAAGDLVPADGVVLDAKDFFVNEALLTGESYPTEKRAAPGGVDEAEIARATNAAFMGTSVVSGSARLLVCRTGNATQLGDISRSLRHTPPPAALERGAYDFGLLIVRLTSMLVLFALLANTYFQRPLLESFLFALALAVGLTPELLPMIVSVTLARGALRMAKQSVIVKRLAAIHDLGSMDVLCVDKTGTLTEASIRLMRCTTIDDVDSDHVLELAWLNSYFESGLRSPLDIAVLERKKDVPEAWTKIDEVPFDFERRRVSVLIERQGRRTLVVKGAPEDVLGRCERYEFAGPADIRSFDDAAKARARDRFLRLSEQGFRVLGIAWREEPSTQDRVAVDDERDFVFAGFAAFLDPPKESAPAAIAALERSGVAIKILTGDSDRVSLHVCAALEIPIEGMLTGPEVAAMSDEALGARLASTNLFCRVTPAQKNRIILALKRRGHVVGFMGDGINDAPSLHTADVGISVDSAVDVAKDAADIILLDRDLRVVERGVREGRRTFGNIMKYVMMGTSSNFGNMFSMAGASVLLPFLPMLPIQILLNNLLYDLSEVAIPLDEVDDEFLAEPRHWDIGFIRNFMLVLGSVSSVFDFLTFGLLLWVFDATAAVFQTGWFVESLATQVLVIFVIRTRRSPLSSRPSLSLAAASLVVVAAAIALPYTAVGAWFGFVPLPPHFLAALVGLVVCYLALAELVKRWFYRRHPPTGVPRSPVARPGFPLIGS